MESSKITQHSNDQDKLLLYQEILKKSSDAIAIIRSDGAYIEQNLAHRDLLGYDDQELRRSTPAIHLGEGVFNDILEKLRRAGRYRGELHSRTKSGRDLLIEVSAFAVKGSDSASVYYVFMQRDITRKKEQEKALEESEGKYAQIFNTAIDAVVIHDLEGNILEVNQKAEDLLGYSRDEMLEMNISTLRPNVPREVFQHAFDMLAKEGMMEIEDEFTTKDGTRFEAEMHTLLVEIRGRRVAQAVVRNITSRKKALGAMQESESILRKAFEATPDPAYLWEHLPDDRIVLKRVNSAIEDLSGGQVDQWLHKDAELIFPSDPWVVKTLRQVMETGAAITTERSFGAHPGRLGWFVWYLAKPTENTILMITRDITEERHALEKLRVSEIQYRRLVETSPDAIILTDNSGVIRMVNQVALKLSGLADETDLIERNILEFVEEQDFKRAKEAFESTFKVRGSELMEFQLRRYDGSTFPAEIRGSIILDPEGDPAGQVLVARDISTKKQTESDLHYARERAILYLDLLTHDFRNQLQMILGGSEMALELATTERARTALREVSRAAQKCERMIAKVKSTEGLHTRSLRVTEVDESLKTAITDFAMLFPDIEVEESILVDQAKVHAGLFLDDLWISLLENAAENGGCSRIWIDVIEDKGGYEVSISDDGKGIDPARRESLFDVTRRFGGVSLHTAKEIVDRCGGKITVEDRLPGKPERGAQFRVWLPKLGE